MEQKKSERAGRGSNAWQPQARQQELDEADRFQVPVFLQYVMSSSWSSATGLKTGSTASFHVS